MTDDVSAAGRTVISKAAVILMTYLNGDVHTLTEIATATGLPLSTAHRLVRELAAWKILERTDDGDYCVGLPLRLIGGAGGTTTSLEERACLVLQDLSQALDADVRLGVLRRPRRQLHREAPRAPPGDAPSPRAPPPRPTRPRWARRCWRSPHPALVDSYLSRGLTAFTPFTVTAPRTGSAGRWRWPGSAGSPSPAGSCEPDRSALAVPVFGPGGRVAAAIEVRVDDPAAELAGRPSCAGHRRAQPLPRARGHPEVTGAGLRPHSNGGSAHGAMHGGAIQPGGIHPGARPAARPGTVAKLRVPPGPHGR